MNENLNLIEILKDCPKGTKFYSSAHGEVELEEVHLNSRTDYRIEVRLSNNVLEGFTQDGRLFEKYNGECMLFPSREQRDWSKFKPKKPKQPKQSKFDPNTLQPFDKVLVRDVSCYNWVCELFSHIEPESKFKYWCISDGYKCCIPYNDDTKHLVGSTKEAPEFYRYWED